MCRAVVPRMRARGLRQDHQPLRRRRDRRRCRASAPTRRRRRRSCGFTETLAEELRGRRASTSTRSRPGALNTRLLDEVLAAGPETGGRGVLRARAEAAGRRAARRSRRAPRWRSSSPRRRATGSPAGCSARSGTTGRGLPARRERARRRATSTRCAASCPKDRGWPSERVVMRGRDRRLRPDRPQAGARRSGEQPAGRGGRRASPARAQALAGRLRGLRGRAPTGARRSRGPTWTS